ncbi:MAG: hypothetical protein ACKOX6_02555 [Bdellovibrio sp.]
MKTNNTSRFKKFLFLATTLFLLAASPDSALANPDLDVDLISENSIQAESFLGLKEVAIAGDSWGFLACLFHSVDRALVKEKMFGIGTSLDCPLTTRTGMRAEHWSDSSQNKRLLKNLKSNPRIRVLILSLGGNDLIKYWNKSLSREQELIIFTTIREQIAQDIREYQRIRPDLKIIVSGYDFPRFTADNKISAYRNVFKKFGEPTPYELNTMLMRFSQEMTKLSDGGNSVAYIHHLGVTEYYRGQAEVGLKPYQTLSPDKISAKDNPARVGGDPRVLNDSNSMAHIEIANHQYVVDAFHLSPTGFYYTSLHTVRMYLKDWLR